MNKRAPRLFAPHLRSGSPLVLDARAAHHLARVLRLGVGDEVVLFDGRGGEYRAFVSGMARGTATLAIGAHCAVERESPFPVTLVQGLSSGEKMDLTVQKAVELGVAAIQPLVAERSLVRLSGARAAARLEHWRRIVVAACEQCGRNRVPPVRDLKAPAAYCREPADASVKLLLSPRTGQGLKDILPDTLSALTLAAGPEAGFSDAEEALLVAAGFRPVRLGPRVLRTETAALAALAALNALRGDFWE
jgi:16S rRNA (uracil1498-N3)-methyltransferase